MVRALRYSYVLCGIWLEYNGGIVTLNAVLGAFRLLSFGFFLVEELEMLERLELDRNLLLYQYYLGLEVRMHRAG